jgi:hypothetical protein
MSTFPPEAILLIYIPIGVLCVWLGNDIEPPEARLKNWDEVK